MNTITEEGLEERKELYRKVNRVREKYGFDAIPYVDEQEILYCSFCGKEPKQIQSMIEGFDVFICNECVDLLHNLIHEHSE